MLNLKSIIVHRVSKNRGEKARVKLRTEEWPITEKHIEFVTMVKEVYYKKSNPIWGVFDKNEEQYPFQLLVKNYLSGKNDFMSFSIKAIEHFEFTITDIPQATGGYVLFAHFHDNFDFIMTIVLSHKSAFNIDDQLDLNKLLSLDIEKLDVANFLNIKRWRDSEETYLSFTPGRKEVSRYFKKFIGCTDQISSKQQSIRLKKALLDYFNKLEIPEDEKN
jgi:nucleoid-associated protein